MQGPICSYKYSGGVNSDYKNNLVGIVAATVAHELGKCKKERKYEE